ncbi:CidA/LrgA family protein [Paenibacillus sp. IHBB 10380]|uniref:CidA/LrgA family protein n=1 Tax=Paenibacillus sp. IHBB 10380 TaxID=1566358 RepID=UPI0005CFA146|nr:CidA/LrgA family protein [Paenibacillus sp. IHBB 10380]AJS59337.1 membrane protein [Paenibacillus sp. IHBB 10380]
MKIIQIIAQVGLLYLFYLAGDYVQQWLHLPIPGSIVGLLLLFVLLLCKIVPIRWIEHGSTAVLSYLPLFFIPATAGIVNHLGIFSGKGLMLIVIIIVSTALTMVAAAHSSQWLAGWSMRSKRDSREKGKEI